MGKFIDLTGQTFGRWLVIRYEGIRNRRGWWYCRCDCGTYRSVSTSQLTRGRSRSCGCQAHAKVMPRKQQQRLWQLYVDEGKSLAVCAAELGYSSQSYLSRVLRRMGAPMRPFHGVQRATDTEEIMRVYYRTKDYGKTARRFGMRRAAVGARIRRYRQQQEARP
jgi:hypothetical protein